MKIGVAKEIKADEYRVALTPAGARELVQRGHEVTIEQGAGEGSAFTDAAYEAAGARIVGVDDVTGLRTSHESVDLRFFAREELPPHDLVEPHRQIIERYLSGEAPPFLD